MPTERKTVKGTLSGEGGRAFISSEGKRFFEGRIWGGYLEFWDGLRVEAGEISARDYESGQPIILVSPEADEPEEPYVELYYNERLKGRILSMLGHTALNINGRVFNYSYFINENEEISPSEYFYRPPLGEFAKHPVTGKPDFENPERPYFHKLGRLFMRSVQVLHIRGLDTENLLAESRKTLASILNHPRNPDKPHVYAAYNYFSNNCVTALLKDLNRAGLGKVTGLGPRDVFTRTACNIIKGKTDTPVRAAIYTLSQLKLPGEEYSALTPFTSPVNIIRNRLVRKHWKFEEKKYWGEGEWLQVRK